MWGSYYYPIWSCPARINTPVHSSSPGGLRIDLNEDLGFGDATGYVKAFNSRFLLFAFDPALSLLAPIFLLILWQLHLTCRHFQDLIRIFSHSNWLLLIQNKALYCSKVLHSTCNKVTSLILMRCVDIYCKWIEDNTA